MARLSFNSNQFTKEMNYLITNINNSCEKKLSSLKSDDKQKIINVVSSKIKNVESELSRLTSSFVTIVAKNAGSIQVSQVIDIAEDIKKIATKLTEEVSGSKDLKDILAITANTKELIEDIKNSVESTSELSSRFQDLAAKLSALNDATVSLKKFKLEDKTAKEALLINLQEQRIQLIEEKMKLLQNDPKMPSAPQVIGEIFALIKETNDLKSKVPLKKTLQDKQDKVQQKLLSTVERLISLHLELNQAVEVSSMKGSSGDAPNVNETCWVCSLDRKGEKLGIFKAAAGEVPTRDTVPKGEGAKREVAAYVLDLINGSAANVPITLGTYQVVGTEKRVGSTQIFEKCEGAVEELTPADFPLISVKAAHQQAIFDLSIFNLDRHPGNFLFRILPNGKIDPRPIDHGLSLPIYTPPEMPTDPLRKRMLMTKLKSEGRTLDDYKYERARDVPVFSWLQWPQVKQELTDFDKQQIAKMQANLPLSERYLRSLHVQEESINLYHATVEMLALGAEHDLTLFQLGTWATQENGPLGRIVIDAQLKAYDPVTKTYDSKIYMEEVKSALKSAVDSIKAIPT